MADDKSEQEQQTEQSTTDEAQVDTGAGDDEVVVVQQGDDLVSYQGSDEVDRRPIMGDEGEQGDEGKGDARDG